MKRFLLFTLINQRFLLRLVRDGIVVMYVSFVLVVFKFFRASFIEGRILYVHLEESPDVNYLLDLMDQMCLAREMKDYWLEEELFAKLIFILRCPDVLFYVTRVREIVRARPSQPHPPEHIQALKEHGMATSMSLGGPLITESESPKYKGVVSRFVNILGHSQPVWFQKEKEDEIGEDT